MKRKLILPGIVTVLFLAVAGFVCVKYYSFVFSKSVEGEIIRVERVSQPQSIMSNGSGTIPDSQLFSFAIAIRDNQGEIHTASSEDRQWAIATVGQCARMKMFPYAPWELDKGSTYYGARLERLFDCPKK